MVQGRKARVVPKTAGGFLALQYLTRERMTQAALARICGMTANALNECVSGKRVPHLGEAFAIRDATDGEVPPRTWLMPLDARMQDAEANAHQEPESAFADGGDADASVAGG